MPTPPMMPLLMVLCLALFLWVRLPILAAAALTSLGFFVLGMQWHLPVEPDWVDLWGRTFFSDAFQALCLIPLMALLLERIGWTSEWVDVIDEWLGPVGLQVSAVLLLLSALVLFLVHSAAAVPMGAIYSGAVFLAMVLLLPYTLRAVVSSVAQPDRIAAMAAGGLLLVYMLVGTLLLALTSVLSVCLTFWLRQRHRGQFMGPPKPLHWGTGARAVQPVIGAVVLILCLWLICWAALQEAASISAFGHPYTTLAAYTGAPLVIAALHLMAARRSMVPKHSRWFRRLIAFTPAYLLFMALSVIYMGLLTWMESALLTTLFLTGLALIRGQFSGRVFVHALLRWAYVVLTGLVMLWFFFPVLDAWMNHSAG